VRRSKRSHGLDRKNKIAKAFKGPKSTADEEAAESPKKQKLHFSKIHVPTKVPTTMQKGEQVSEASRSHVSRTMKKRRAIPQKANRDGSSFNQFKQ
jgi:formiminotetrahydrofolate cyclodeaminase